MVCMCVRARACVRVVRVRMCEYASLRLPCEACASSTLAHKRNHANHGCTNLTSMCTSMHVCTHARIRICTPPRAHMDEHLTQEGVQKLHKEHGPDKVHCKRQIHAVTALQVLCGRANARSVDEELQHDVHALHIASSLADRGQHAQIRLDVADGCIGLIRGLQNALAYILKLGGAGRRRAVSACAPMRACTRMHSHALGAARAAHTHLTHDGRPRQCTRVRALARVRVTRRSHAYACLLGARTCGSKRRLSSSFV